MDQCYCSKCGEEIPHHWVRYIKPVETEDGLVYEHYHIYCVKGKRGNDSS